MLTSELRYGDLWSMREFNHFDFELNGIIRAFYALRLMISWIASIFGVHYSLRNFRICQTVLRRRLRFSAEVTCFIKLNCDKMAIEKVQLTYSDSVVARW